METKKVILNLKGYRYLCSREIYFNLQSKKVFSREIIEDNTKIWLIDKIQKKSNSERWEIYTNNTLSTEAKTQLITELKNL